MGKLRTNGKQGPGDDGVWPLDGFDRDRFLAVVSADPTLTPTDHRVAEQLAAHVSWKKGTCWMFHRTIADAIGHATVSHVRASVRKLDRRGYIERVPRLKQGWTTANGYRLVAGVAAHVDHAPGPVLDHPPGPRVDHPIEHGLEHGKRTDSLSSQGGPVSFVEGLQGEPLSEERSSDGSHVGDGSGPGVGHGSRSSNGGGPVLTDDDCYIIDKVAGMLAAGRTDAAARCLGGRVRADIAPASAAVVLDTYRSRGYIAAHRCAKQLGPKRWN